MRTGCLFLMVLAAAFVGLLCGCDRGVVAPNGGGSQWFFRDIGASVSPDGDSVAYAHAATGEEGDTSGVYVASLVAQSTRLATKGLVNDIDWSSDGPNLAFDKGGEIWVLDLGADSTAQVTQPDGHGKSLPKWAPDSEKLAYVVALGAQAGAWVVDSGGVNAHRIAPNAQDIDWFSSGTEIVLAMWVYDSLNGTWNAGLWRADSAGAPIQVILTAESIGAIGGTLMGISVSPDDAKVAFHAQRGGEAPQVWVVHADGSNPTQLTSRGGIDPDWSPDGLWIVYTDGRDGRLWRIGADGDDSRPLDY